MAKIAIPVSTAKRQNRLFRLMVGGVGPSVCKGKGCSSALLMVAKMMVRGEDVIRLSVIELHREQRAGTRRINFDFVLKGEPISSGQRESSNVERM